MIDRAEQAEAREAVAPAHDGLLAAIWRGIVEWVTQEPIEVEDEDEAADVWGW